MSGSCESCGAPDERTFAVHRRYVTPPEWDTLGRDVVVDEIERWCYACCAHYPHVPVEGPDAYDAGTDEATE